VHWLTGANADAPLYRLWRDTGILADGVKTCRDDPYLTLTMGNGGLPIALYSGFRAAQYVCRDNKVVFEGNV
jgi:hypothetical protein